LEVDLEQSTATAHYDADICIAGAGIAGLVLADALIGTGLKVALLEGGGKSLETRSQDLYKVKMVGQPHSGASEGRFRIYGGSSTRWGGQMLSYTDDIFSPPLETNMPSWPIRADELQRFYPSVLKIMGVPDGPFETGTIAPAGEEGGAGDEPGDAKMHVRYSRWAPFTRRNLAGTLGRGCLESANVTVFFHANVTRLERNGNAIRTVHARNYAGGDFTFSARSVIICLGTIECSRLLLHSNVGNAADQVGRYFHDHIGIHAATLQGVTRAKAARLFLPQIHHGALYTPKLEATATWRREHGGQAVMAHFPIVEVADSPAATVRLLLQSVQRRELAPGLLRRLAKMPAGSLDLFRLAYATRVRKRRALSKHAELRLNIDVEQHPLAESRITLTPESDALGVPVAQLDWRISEAEQRTVRLFAQTVQEELRSVGLDQVAMHPDLLRESGDLKALMSDTYHMMGGTRMGSTTRDSVVDKDLRVHGFDHLYVASCSVFPSGGSSNPTFTLMALALRLADRLKANAKPS
jgi:choline dehydrogenase-like flavoprotein